MVRNGNPEGDFNTYGQEKCWHCGLWFPEAVIFSHADNCVNNPDNQKDTDE